MVAALLIKQWKKSFEVKKLKKLFDTLVDGSVALISRFLPDAYILVLLLTVILFIAAIPVTGIAPAEGITVLDRLIDLVYKGWYGGFWNLLGFGMQMVLIVVTGTMFANTEPVHKIIVKIASVPKTPKQALILVSAVGMVAYFLQWGAALIVCAVLAQEVAKKVKGIHYPLLVAAAYVGNAFCLVGISGTIALNVAGGWNFEGVWSTTGIPFRETVFAPYNLFIYVVGAIVLCLLITAMHPSPEKTKTVDPSIFNEVSAAKVYKSPSEMTPAEKLETSVLLNGAITCIGFFCVIWSFVDSLYIKKQSFSLSINQVNMIFLFASIAMYKTPVRTVEAVKKSLGGAVGVVLQMPFYAGIAELISYNGGSTGVSIAQVIAGFFVHISNAQTFPLFTCLSAVIVKLFVPSGGAQWAVQGPIVMQAVQSFMPAVSEGKAAMALSWGNSCCNLLQPFWLIPVLEVAKLKVRDVMGYCVICLIALLVIISAGLLFL